MIHGVLAFFLSFSPLYLILVLSSFSFQMHHHVSISGSVHPLIHLSVFPFLHSSVWLPICPSICLFACPLHLCSNCADDALSCLDELNHFIFTSMKCSVCCLVGWFIGCSRLSWKLSKKLKTKALRSDHSSSIISFIYHIHTTNCSYMSNMRDNFFLKEKSQIA